MKKIQFQLNAHPKLNDFDTLVLPVFSNGQSIGAAAEFGVNGLIDALDKQDDFKGKIAQTLMLHQVAQLDCPRLLLVGMGIRKN